MAASRVGAVYVGLNPRYKAAEVAQAVLRAQPRLIVTLRAFEGQDFLALLESAAPAHASWDDYPVLRFADVVASVNVDALVIVYAALRPALEAAYRALGYPDGSIDKAADPSTFLRTYASDSWTVYDRAATTAAKAATAAPKRRAAA